MNKAIAYLFHAFDKAGIEVFLLKGQAVAQFYPQPLHRVHGDIDLLVPDAQNFEKAIALMQSLTGEEGEPEDERSHVVCRDSMSMASDDAVFSITSIGRRTV